MAISKYGKKFEYGKILTEGDLNGMVDAINLTIDGVNSVDAKSETAIKEATTAKNAVKTLEGLADSTEAMKILAGQVVQIEENKKDIFFLKGADQKEIADTIVWTKGVWNYTNNSGGGSSYQTSTYRYSNKIDISNYDEVILSGLWNGSSSSSNNDRKASVTFFGDGEPIGWQDSSVSGAIINIYRSDYAQYNKLEIIVNAFQSEETYVPSVKVSAEGNAVLKEEFDQLKEKVNSNELAISNLVGNEFDLSLSLQWGKGYINTDGTIAGNTTVYRHTYVDVRNYDIVTYSGLIPGNQQTTNNRAINVVADGVIVKNIGATSGEIICSDYEFNESLVLAISARTDTEVTIVGVVTRKIPTQEEYNALKEQVSTNENGIEALKTTIDGVNDKEIADTIVWTKGVWNYTNNSGGGSPYENSTYRYSNKIDISLYDSVVLSGLANGNAMSNAENRRPTISIFGDGEPIAYQQVSDGNTFVIYRADYAQYNKLEIIILAYQSEETYVPSVKATKKGIAEGNAALKEEFNALKEQVSTNENGIEALKTTIEGVNGKEIADTIVWTKGVWNYTNNSGGGSSYQTSTYRYSNKIDISNYDEVMLSGLWNGSSVSSNDNRIPTVSFFGDGEPIGWQDIAPSGATTNIYRADYAQYNKLEIVVNALQSEETYVPSVKVTKKGIAEGGGAVAKRIVLCGDSLTGNDSALLTYEFKSIAKSQGYEIVRNSMGGEDIIGNLTRNGGIGIRVTQEFTIPASGSVNIFIESAWMKSDGTYAQNPYNSLSNRNVIIMGVEGKLTRVSTTEYTFTRNGSGNEMKVGVGVIFWDKALWDCRDYPHVWFTGQNGGYENEADWADMINSAARNFGENFIVCSTALSRTTNELVRQATKTFGDKYINLRAYTQGQAVYDGQRYGLIDSSYTAADYEALFWPGSDKIHNNNLLAYIWAVLMWNTLLDLGYVEGERIDTGEYYLE